MFTNKTNWIVLVVALTVVALICSSVIAFKSIEEAKNENQMANSKIEELNNSLDVLGAALDSTNNEVLNHEEKIKNYQEILAAWSKATPDVSDAVKRIILFLIFVDTDTIYPKRESIIRNKVILVKKRIP